MIQLPTRKLCGCVSLCEPLAFRFAVTVQPFGSFVARRRHCAPADSKDSKSGERRDGGGSCSGGLALLNGGWGCGCGGTSSSRLSHTERRQGTRKGGATEMKSRGGEFAEGGEETALGTRRGYQVLVMKFPDFLVHRTGMRRPASGHWNPRTRDGRGSDVPAWPQLRGFWNSQRQREVGSGAILAVNVVCMMILY